MAICATLIYAAAIARLEFDRDDAFASDIKLDEASIALLPLADGEARLWTYRIPSVHFAKGFVIEYSAVPRLNQNRDRSIEISSTSLIKRDYRYVVLDRTYFPTEDSVRSTTGSLEPTQSIDVRYAKCDDIIVLRRTIVVSKACAASFLLPQ